VTTLTPVLDDDLGVLGLADVVIGTTNPTAASAASVRKILRIAESP